MSTFSEDSFSRDKGEVSASDVATAIADGKNIAIKSCIISGDLEVHGRPAKGSISILGTTFANSVSFHKVAFSGPNVEFRNCEFAGGVTFNESTFGEHKETVRFDGSRFHKGVSFQDTNFNRSASFEETDFIGEAIFEHAIFKSDVSFRLSAFRREASFGSAVFRTRAEFSSAIFEGNADFRRATFIKQLDFAQAYLRLPANFAKVDFRENTIRISLWKYVLRYIFRYQVFLLLCFVSLFAGVWEIIWKCGERNREELRQAVQFVCREWRSRNRKEPSAQSICRIYKKLQGNIRLICPFPCESKGVLDTRELLQASRRLVRSKWERICLWGVITDFYSLNTDTVMDGSSNPYLKRYIEEEQWLESWRTSKFWRKPVFMIWELTSHCGRSFWLWAVWAVTIVVVFAVIYNYWVDIVYNVSDLTDRIRPHEPDFLTYMYYSVATFTTLGFGDIIPLDNKARAAVWSEVVLGYIMLAVLLTIVGNRVARPS